jgi:hypothetical protein
MNTKRIETMTNEQAEYIAKRVAEIYKKSRGKVIVNVIPPATSSEGHLNYMFTASEIEQPTGEDDSLVARIV